MLLQLFVATDLHESVSIYLGCCLLICMVIQSPGDFFSSRTAAEKSVFSLFVFLKPLFSCFPKVAG